MWFVHTILPPLFGIHLCSELIPIPRHWSELSAGVKRKTSDSRCSHLTIAPCSQAFCWQYDSATRSKDRTRIVAKHLILKSTGEVHLSNKCRYHHIHCLHTTWIHTTSYQFVDFANWCKNTSLNKSTNLHVAKKRIHSDVEYGIAINAQWLIAMLMFWFV